MKPILYSFRRCPYAMRARLALDLANIAVEHREVVLQRKPSAMLAASPKGTVPVLVLSDGTVLEQSLDIFYWALGQDVFNTVQSRLLFDNDGAFKRALDRYKYDSRVELQVEGKTAIDFRSEALIYLNKLDRYLAVHIDDDCLLLECAILPFVRQFRGVDPQWFDTLPFIRLAQSLAQFVESKLFERVMQKHPEWSADFIPKQMGVS